MNKIEDPYPVASWCHLTRQLLIYSSQSHDVNYCNVPPRKRSSSPSSSFLWVTLFSSANTYHANISVKTKNPYYATSWNKGCIIKMHTDGRKSCHHDSPSLSQGPSAICDVSDSLYICSLLIPTKQLSQLTLSKSSHGSGLLQPTLNSCLHSIFSFPGSWKIFPMLLISSS